MGPPFPELPIGLPDDDPLARQVFGNFPGRSLENPLAFRDWFFNGRGPHPDFNPNAAPLHYPQLFSPQSPTSSRRPDLFNVPKELGESASSYWEDTIRKLTSSGTSDNLDELDQDIETFKLGKYSNPDSLTFKNSDYSATYNGCKRRLEQKNPLVQSAIQVRANILGRRIGNFRYEREKAGQIEGEVAYCWLSGNITTSGGEHTLWISTSIRGLELDKEPSKILNRKNGFRDHTNGQVGLKFRNINLDLLNRLDMRAFYVHARKLGLPPEIALRLVINSDLYYNRFSDPQDLPSTEWYPKHFYMYGYPEGISDCSLESTRKLMQKYGEFLGRLAGLEKAVMQVSQFLSWKDNL